MDAAIAYIVYRICAISPTASLSSAEEICAAAGQALSAAFQLCRQFEHLGAEVARFLATARAA